MEGCTTTGVSEKNMAGKHNVEFIGAEEVIQDDQSKWGKLVKYGTSVPLARAMNPAYDILNWVRSQW